MKLNPWEYPPFISPMSGRINFSGVQSLTPDYTFLGDNNGFAIESPILIDIRLDIIQIRNKLGTTPFILRSGVSWFDDAQALDQLTNGFLYNNDKGILSIEVPGPGSIALPYNQVFLGDVDNLAQASPTIQLLNFPDLTENYFWLGNSSNRVIETNILPIGALPDLVFNNIWIGDNSNRAAPNQRIGNINLPPFVTPDPTSNFGIYNLYTGGTVNVDNFINDPGPVPSTTLRIDMSNMPNLSTGKIWMGVVNAVPPGLTVDTTYPYFHLSSGSLNWDALGILLDSHAVPQEVGLDPGTIFMGDFDNPGQIMQTGLPWGRMFIGNGFGQITNVGLLPYQLFSGNPDASGQIIPITILDRTNLPILTLNNLWVGDGLDQAFPIPVGIGLNTISGLNIADTGVVPGSYTSANITVNAQGQITAATNGEGSGGTVTEITLGTGLTGIPNPIIETGTISITPTGVVAGAYGYATIIVNPQGQLLEAINNSANIENIEDNIDTNTSNISTINTTLYDPVTGIVNAVTVLNTAIFAPVTGLIVAVSSNTDKISEIVDAADTYISQIEENTTDIANNTSDIAGNTSSILGIISGIIPIDSTFTAIGDVSGSGPLSSPITLTLNTTLNNVPLATGDVDVNNHKIINVNDATNPKDAVNLETLIAYVGGLAVTLDGFVIGGPAVDGVLTTSRGPDCTLDVIPAVDNVSINNFSLYNVAPIPDDIYTNYLSGQAINFDWFLKFLNNQQMLVGFAPDYIFPKINLTGQTQNFEFQKYQLLSRFQIQNLSVPTINSLSQNCFELLNTNSSGFRFKQVTSSASTSGKLVIEKFSNDSTPGSSIVEFSESNEVQVNENINMEGNAIYDVENIQQDLYSGYLVGQVINIDWLRSFLNNEVI